MGLSYHTIGTGYSFLFIAMRSGLILAGLFIFQEKPKICIFKRKFDFCMIFHYLILGGRRGENAKRLTPSIDILLYIIPLQYFFCFLNKPHFWIEFILKMMNFDLWVIASLTPWNQTIVPVYYPTFLTYDIMIIKNT